MFYVYLLVSIKNPSKRYIGFTADIMSRLETHNSGGSTYTKHDRPWRIVSFVTFDTQEKATAFEKYIKIGSGAAFANKRLW